MKNYIFFRRSWGLATGDISQDSEVIGGLSLKRYSLALYGSMMYPNLPLARRTHDATCAVFCLVPLASTRKAK